MPLILAIEPDRRQSARVAALAKKFLNADIAVVPSVDAALEKLKTARPDLVLTPLLLSTRDDSALTRRLRELAEDGLELQTLVIPVLAAGENEPGDDERSGGGLLNRLRKPKSSPAVPSGCEPEVFASQITEYLERLAAEHHDREHTRRRDAWVTETAASAPMLGELLTMPASETPRPASMADIAPYGGFDQTPVDRTPDIREALFPALAEEKIEHPSAGALVEGDFSPGEPLVRPPLPSLSSLADDEPAPAPRAEEPLWFNEPEPTPAAAHREEPRWFGEPIVRPAPAPHVDEPVRSHEPIVRPEPFSFSTFAADADPVPAATPVDEPAWSSEPIVFPEPTPFSVRASDPEPAPAVRRAEEPAWSNEPVVRPELTSSSAFASDPIVHPELTSFSVPASDPEPAPAVAHVEEPAWSNEPIVRPEPVSFSTFATEPAPAPVPPVEEPVWRTLVRAATTSFSALTSNADPVPTPPVEEVVSKNERIEEPAPTSDLQPPTAEARQTPVLSDLVVEEFSSGADETTDAETARNEPAVPLPSAEPDHEVWEDLESILEEFEIETTDAVIDAPVVVAAAPVVAAKEELEVLDVPATDEPWEALESGQEPIVAPDEEPQLKKRRAPTPKKSPKAARTATAKAAKAKPKPPRTKTKKQQRPMQDEWGLYDPEQCGFAALLERLEELTDSEAREK